MKSHDLALAILKLPNMEVVCSEDDTYYGSSPYTIYSISEAFIKKDRLVHDSRQYEKVFNSIDGFEDCEKVICIGFINREK